MKTRILTSIFFISVTLLFATNSYSVMRHVAVQNFSFTPATLNANVGDTVRWTLLNGSHTTTCDGSSFTLRPPGAAPWSANLSPGTPIFQYVLHVAGTYNYKCIPHTMLGTINVATIPLNLNLTSIIEGFWNGSTMVSDTIKVYLHNSTSPYARVDSAKVKLSTLGNGLMSFTNAPGGSYFIDVRHRNALETWSSTFQFFTIGGTVNYDFTTAANKAYGDNQVLKGGKYTIYSGDVNQDGTIDGTDLSLIDNDAFNFVSGYVKTDVNGDNVIDGSDASITENNAANFVSVMRPGAFILR